MRIPLISCPRIDALSIVAPKAVVLTVGDVPCRTRKTFVWGKKK